MTDADVIAFYAAIVATYAAFVATLVLFWDVLKWFRQKGRLKISASICKNRGTYTESANTGEWGELLRVDVANFGGQDVTITGIGLSTVRPTLFPLKTSPKMRFFPNNDQTPMPHTLSPSMTMEWLFDSAILLDARAIKNLYARDSLHRTWKIPGKEIRHMKNVIKIQKQKKTQ